MAHHFQFLPNSLIGQEIKERRLRKLNGSCLLECIIEYRIARLVVEVRQDNRVLLGKDRRGWVGHRLVRVEIEKSSDGHNKNRGGRNQNLPESSARASDFRNLHSRR